METYDPISGAVEESYWDSLQSASTSWILSTRSHRPKKTKGAQARIVFLGDGALRPEATPLATELRPWQLAQLNSDGWLSSFDGVNGPVWVIRPWRRKEIEKGQRGQFALSPFAAARDGVGTAVRELRVRKPGSITIQMIGADAEEKRGAAVGLEIAGYTFKESFRLEDHPALPIHWAGLEKNGTDMLTEGAALGTAINLTRHLVNLPPLFLQPDRFGQFILRHFRKTPGFQVTIWNSEKCLKEKMGLLLGVGMGARHHPRLVHMKYRPTTGRRKGQAPIAFVGKGITFDSGGLGIKPALGMRLMKKDMGGAAALCGVAHWLAMTKTEVPCDFYLALAENSISRDSLRPGDILKSRSGRSVEIHHTDAEGRLILADALDVAVTAKGGDEPAAIIDVATLTGAIKTALGSDVAGLFSNDDDLAAEILQAAQASGEWVWPMPLVRKYLNQLQVPVADLQNCSEGFGGAITAALFLESFVRDKSWAHLDIYAWQEKKEGPYAEVGASGQAVQLLTQYLTFLAAKYNATRNSK